MSFVDRKQVARRFSRVAQSYAGADFFAREVDRRMQERLDYVRLVPARILDMGCSCGGSSDALAARYPDALQFGVDTSEAMLRAGRPERGVWSRWFGRQQGMQRIAADASALPLQSRSMGLVWSNLMLHWLDSPLPALAEAHRVLEVGGLLMFSTLGPDTLRELNQVFGDGYAHTQRFTDMHDLGDMLVESGFSDPVVDMEMITLTYDDLDSLFGELRAAGSSCAMQARRHTLTGAKRFAAARLAYEAMRSHGKLPASFELIYGHAWKVAPKQLADGRSVVQFDLRPKR